MKYIIINLKILFLTKIILLLLLLLKYYHVPTYSIRVLSNTTPWTLLNLSKPSDILGPKSITFYLTHYNDQWVVFSFFGGYSIYLNVFLKKKKLYSYYIILLYF